MRVPGATAAAKLRVVVAACFLASCDREGAPRNRTQPGEHDSSAAQVEEIDEEGAGGAVAVVHAYFQAITSRDYERAYRFWGESGPPGQSLQEFARGFAATESVRVVTGPPSRIDPAAGSRFIEVPVEIFAQTTGGEEQHFTGKYILRRAVVDGASPAQRRWHFTRAEIVRD